MIWFDLVTPKSVLFFKPIIENMKYRGKDILVTARSGDDYTEVVELLKLHHIEFQNVGTFGGAELKDKLYASIERQGVLADLVQTKNIEKLVCLCSVDASRVAYGLGIPIINFCDIPLSDYSLDIRKSSPQVRLSLPLSDKVFHPHIVPKSIFTRFALDASQIYTYHFLDVMIWLRTFKPQKTVFDEILLRNNLPMDRPTIIVREEEYKSSYVNGQCSVLYKGVIQLKEKIQANFIIIPRYGCDYVKREFPFALVLEEKVEVQHLLAFADLFIGGGGTLNSEACYFGTPTLSTRSFTSHYDKALLDEGLMSQAFSADDVVNIGLNIIGKKQKRKGFFKKMNVDVNEMVDQILGP